MHAAAAAAAESLQSCPTLCDPIDGSPPGSSIPVILQARILEWVAISFTHMHMHILTHIHIHIHTCACTYTHILTCICTHTHAHEHTHMHIHTHTYAHTHTSHSLTLNWEPLFTPDPHLLPQDAPPGKADNLIPRQKMMPQKGTSKSLSWVIYILKESHS